MQLFLVVVCLVLAVAAKEPITTNYHEAIGIPEAARIKNAEAALDFDGARIVGGSPSALGAYPHMGGLLVDLLTGQTSVCGSSLLSNTKLVTAAHCWWDGTNAALRFTVILGSVTLFSGGTRIITNQVEIHEDYNRSNLNNDIAIITIDWVSFSNTINSIGLAAGTNAYVGSWATAAGFGRTSDGTGIPSNQILSHVNLQVITNAACAVTYGNSVIVSSTLCTSGANAQSTCGGDSGGPLGVGNTLIGVTSFGASSGCERGFPVGFARISYFFTWIRARL